MVGSSFAGRYFIALAPHKTPHGSPLRGVWAVAHALRELVRRKERQRIRGLRGTVEWTGELDESRRGPSSVIVVDTSVWIDYFAGRVDETHVAELLRLDGKAHVGGRSARPVRDDRQ